ncbi:MAG: hypothetical protein LBI82_12250 [Dysgonamonadaceae bacterium]|jgi:hypothetical protein|nr:hypothetical protein [Dysgonamonadaceae bacterium]
MREKIYYADIQKYSSCKIISEFVGKFLYLEKRKLLLPLRSNRTGKVESRKALQTGLLKWVGL